MSTKQERYSATMEAIRARQEAKRPKPAPAPVEKKAKPVISTAKAVNTYVTIEEPYPDSETVEVVEDTYEEPDGS